MEAPRISSCPVAVRRLCLREARSSRWRPVMVSLAPQPLDLALEADGAARRAGAGAEVDDVVGDRNRLGLVLDDEHRVALVAQPQQQVVHPLDVVRVQADRRLVEDIGDVGERGAEVADHLGALRLAPRQRARRPVEREVAQPDLDERVEGLLQRGEQRRHRRLVEAADPGGQVADLHCARVGDVDPADPRRPGGLAEPGALAFGAGGEGDRAVYERPNVRLHRFPVLREHRLLDPRDQPLVGQVDAVDLDLGRLLVQQVVQLPLREIADWLVRVEEAGALEDAAVPAVHAVAGDRDRALVDRLALVVERGQVEVGDGAPALAARAHAAGSGEGRFLGSRLGAALDRDPTTCPDRRDVEGIRAGRADVRLPEAAEEDPQHRVGVGGRADRRAGVGAHPLLVDDDRRRQPVQNVDLRPRQCWHEALDEGAVCLVDQPL